MKLSSKKELEFEVLLKSLVGKKIEILSSKIKSQEGLKGTIIYESANFFHIKPETGDIVKIMKKNIKFKTTVEGKPLYIDGRLLFSTVLSRIKKIK